MTKDLCDILQFNLQANGYDVKVAYSTESTLSLLLNVKINLILLDIMMEGMSGFELAQQVN